jgi:DNA invertase Pin-like site-specific DNA recombinase
VQATLDSWLEGTRVKPAYRGDGTGRLRFAFYGRMSTVGYQDPGTSRGCQREMAESLIGERGVIVAEFFDIDCSRRVPWQDRPQASALLAALADPRRGFDAIVVGEYERAFAMGQFEQVAPLLAGHGVEVWLPEAGGPVEFDSPLHRALVSVLGAQSQREVLRGRHRVLAAMRAQVVEQGRYLGGRPPYGYRLVDAGPHPNRTYAGWGRCAQRLAPDPVTAPHVRWIFTQRLAGRSAAEIARALNERGVPCPSSVDQARNRHRSGEGWSLRTVIEILRNPRYTGREVWNRVGTDRSRRSSTGRCASRRTSQRSWVVSAEIAHEPLVSERDFVAAQTARASRVAADGATRTFRLSGLLRCGVCGRRMDAHWVHGRPGYRCRHGYTSARRRPVDAARNLYLREDQLITRIVGYLSEQGHVGQPDPDGVVTFLRGKDLTVLCQTAELAIITGDQAPDGNPGEASTNSAKR